MIDENIEFKNCPLPASFSKLVGRVVFKMGLKKEQYEALAVSMKEWKTVLFGTLSPQITKKTKTAGNVSKCSEAEASCLFNISLKNWAES